MICTLLQTQLSAKPVRPAKKWKDVHKLLLDEKKTIRRLGARGIIYKHRIFEIDNELMKIVRDKEHKRFFELAKKNKIKGRKEDYYKNSMKLYYNNKRLGMEIIKRYPRYNRISEIYYSLGLNERDYNSSKDSEYFFIRANKFNKNKALGYKINVELAEYYYNKKEYTLAGRYYSKVVLNKDDKWLTKHMYNYAWCVFKEKKYKQAILLLNQSLDLGKTPKYLEVTEQVYEAAVSFYVFSKNILPGINFFKKNKGNEYYWLHKFSKKAAEKGFYKESLAVMAEALSFATEKEKNELFLSKVIIARNNKDIVKYDETIKELEKRSKSLSDQERKELVAEVLNFAGLMQRKLQQSFNKVTNKYSSHILSKALGYFDTLITIDVKKKDQYRFFQGETLFGVTEFERASKYYLSGLKNNLNQKAKDRDKELQGKLFNAMFSLLTSSDIPKKLRDKYAFYTYGKYLKEHPKDKKSVSVYRALFDLSIEYKKHNYAFSTLKSFTNNHKNLKGEHKKMFFYLFDSGIQNQVPDFLAGLVSKMNQLKVGITKQEKDVAVENLGGLVFHNIESKENKVENDLLIKEYSNLFANKLYPSTIRANSALKLSHFLADNFRTKDSFEWIKKSLALYEKKELDKRIDVYNNFSYLFVELQDFESAEAMMNVFVNKYCTHPKNKINELIILRMNVAQVMNKEISLYKDLHGLVKCGLKYERNKEIKEFVVSNLIETMNIDTLSKIVKIDKNAATDRVVNFFYQNYWRDIDRPKSFSTLEAISKYNEVAFKRIGQIADYKKLMNEIKNTTFTNLSKVITKDNFEEKLAEFIGLNIEKSASLISNVSSRIVAYHDVAKVNVLKSLTSKLNENIQYFESFTIEELDAETLKIVQGEVFGVAKDLRTQAQTFETKVSSLKSTSIEMISKVKDIKLFKADMNRGVTI